MPLLDPVKLRSAGTARTYPTSAAELTRIIEEAVRNKLPGWKLESSSETEVRAVRRTRLGFVDDVVVRLSEKKTGDRTNTHARMESTSRVGIWDLGQNNRNLRDLLDAVDRELRVETG